MLSPRDAALLTDVRMNRSGSIPFSRSVRFRFQHSKTRRTARYNSAGLPCLGEARQYADPPYALVLLRVGRERPRSQASPQKADEIAPFHVVLT
jgi:hypothetical protein